MCVLVFSASVSAQKNKFAPLSNSRTTNEAIAGLEKDIPNLMKLSDVPGISAALIRDGKIVWSKGFGFANAETREPVTNETIFEAASLSKVVFAYGVLKLVDAGKLDLDVPLNKYLGNNYEVGDDARLNLITARRVLSHTAGFPNWRAPDAKTLPINFTPGEKFSYSGEGFVYLSVVVEKITGMKLEDFMQKTVLIPLQMTSSSYQWQDKYDRNGAYRHDLIGNKLFRNQGKNVNAAASLRTTAVDYAKFIAALLNGKGLKKKTFNQMFTPQIVVNEKSPQVFWGLGVGLETTDEGKSFWHWGDQGDTKAYFTAFLPKKDAIVYFANSPNGLSITKEVLDDAIGGKHPAVAYLDYARYDNDPARTLLKAIIEKGASDALKNYREQREQPNAAKISESRINRIGYVLLQMKKIEDALEVFRLNTLDFPNSANVWDSLADAYQAKGDKESAIKYYEKSLELNPQNNNAVEQLKKLKQ
ncbi:MAG TPA: serine hydrolase [Pyrinomonadaceae bacterium]|nr:serine hydrolase [Pyrinomonadaceae bacterium]